MANLRVVNIAPDAPDKLVVAAARVADAECCLIEAEKHIAALINRKYYVIRFSKFYVRIESLDRKKVFLEIRSSDC